MVNVRERFPVASDIFERVASTAIQSTLALATADGIELADWLQIDSWRSWGFVGLVTAFSLVKSILATKVSGPGASLAPSVKLEPVSG